MSSGDDALDTASWAKTLDEVNRGVVLEPVDSLDALPFDMCRVLLRKGLWEQHGGAAEPSCRNIDDALSGGQNDAAGYQFTHRPCDLDR